MTIVTPPRKEIWVRKFYIDDVTNGTVTTIFRPSRRLLHENHPKALGAGEIVKVRVVDKPGADWKKVYGELLLHPNRAAQITDVEVRKFTEFVDPADFVGSTADVQNNQELRINLAHIYNMAASGFGDHLWVTRTRFEYVPALDAHGFSLT